ncbi:MAG: hypothetical protein JW839_17815 [Candidatus Lokiarchaeota archaeon]|nr:hypothetical protein [Candidatus Lokiarchaeota archaeon]
MTLLTRGMLAEALDAVLSQQFISDDFTILNRQKKESVRIPGTKFTYLRVKNAILEGVQYVLSEQMDKYIEYLSAKFKVPRKAFDDKLASFGEQQLLVMDNRMKFTMVIATLREFWQDVAYKQVLDEIRKTVYAMNMTAEPPTVDQINRIVSADFGPDFSMMVNIYVLKEMGRLAGTPLQYEDAWFHLMDGIASEVVLKITGQ